MDKKIIITAILILFSITKFQTSFSQNSQSTNSGNDDFVITEEFTNNINEIKPDWLSCFNEGLAIVKKDEKYGFIDKSGKVVIPIQFSTAWDFSEGLACVQKVGERKMGYINKQGELVIPAIFDRSGFSRYNFHDGVARLLKDGMLTGVNKEGKILFSSDLSTPRGWTEFSNGLLLVSTSKVYTSKNGRPYRIEKYGYINKNGKIAIPMDFDYADDFKEEWAITLKNGIWSFIDKNGNTVLTMNLSSNIKRVNNFSEGIAVFWENRTLKCGCIDKKGNVIIPLQKYSLEEFHDGLIMAGLNGKNGFMDKKGRLVIPIKFDYAHSFYEGLALVAKETDGDIHDYGFIDKNGNIVIPMKFDFASDFNEGLAVVMKGDKYGYVDKHGNTTLSE